MMKWHLTSVQSDWQSRRGELHKLNQTVEHNYVKSVDKVYVLVTETPGTAELLQFLLHVVACGGGGLMTYFLRAHPFYSVFTALSS